MSMAETEKWASQIINELFEEDIKDSEKIKCENMKNEGIGRKQVLSNRDLNERDLTSSKSCDNLLSGTSSSMPVNNSEETKIIEDLINDMVSIIEINIDEAYTSALETSFVSPDAIYSEALKSNDFQINSLINSPFFSNAVLKFLYEKLELKDSLNFQRNDEIVKTLGLNDCDKESNASGQEKRDDSQSSKDLHFDYIVENFFKEQIEYRCRKYGLCNQRNSFQSNQSEVGSELQHAKIEKSHEKAITEVESAVELTADEYSSQEIGKEKSFERVILSDTCDERPKTSFENISGDFEKNCLQENVIMEEAKMQSNLDKKCVPENFRRNIFDQFEIVQREQNISLWDADDDEVTFGRSARIVAAYRNMCITIETFFVRPFGHVVAECIDLIIFVHMMILCLLYLLCENVLEKVLNSSNKSEPSSKKVLKTQEKVITSGDFGLFNQMISEEDTTEGFVEIEESVFHLLMAKEKINIDENPVDFHSLLLVDPTNVLKIVQVCPSDDEADSNKDKMFQDVGDFIESLYREEQHTAVSAPSENCLVKILSNSELNENDFDTEIIASSLSLGYKLYESGESSSFKVFTPALIPGEIQGGDDKAEYSVPANALEISIDSPFKFKPIAFHPEKYILNSTEIEDTNLMAASRSNSSLNILPPGEDGSGADKFQLPLNDKLVSSSSLIVNVSSLCSRSEGDVQNNSCSISSMPSDVCCDATDSVIGITNNENQMQPEGYNCDKTISVVNFNPISAEELTNIQIDSNKRISLGAKLKFPFHKLSPNNFRTKSLKKLNAACLQELDHTDDYSPNTGSDGQKKFYAQLEDLDYDARDAKLSNCNSSSEYDTLMEASDKKMLGNGNLRQRMSSIFNNWKNMQVMQCAAPNTAKSKGFPNLKIIKKCKKYFEKS